jgi:predicted deacetylase
MPAAEKRRVCISIHDVAPATWPDCLRLLEMVDAFGPVPVTLLVVPDYHRAGRIDRFPDFVRSIEKRLARGDEVALHGYFHLDESPAPRAPLGWFQRRVLTRSEGEFAALSCEEAQDRLQSGLSVMNSLGWPVQGFVAPAWLPGSAGRAVLARFPFSYTTTRAGIYLLPAWRFTWSPSLVYSVGAAWRHLLSESLDRIVLATARNNDLLRLSLHPVDAGCPQALSHWRSLIECLLRSRTPVTKAQWASAGRQCSSVLAA